MKTCRRLPTHAHACTLSLSLHSLCSRIVWLEAKGSLLSDWSPQLPRFLSASQVHSPPKVAESRGERERRRESGEVGVENNLDP